ncbi:MAG TPA: DNA polymerase IV, partial [Calditrichaeota bacterium]|nr:DNA polymerase IV [Calditrichota bacterium]
AMGIHTIGRLADFPRDVLKSKLGKMGEHFYNLAHGIDNRPVVKGEGVKSISNEHTFGEDVIDQEMLMKTLLQLSEKVGYRLRKKDLQGRTIHLKLRYDNFQTITRNKTLATPADSTQMIFNTIQRLFEQNYQTGRRVRLLGVGVSGFGDETASEQLSLFDKTQASHSELDRLQDLLTDRFGKKTVSRAESLPRGKDTNDLSKNRF